jgi:YD repeat-containing protein
MRAATKFFWLAFVFAFAVVGVSSAARAVTADSVSYTYYPDGRLETVKYANGTTITYTYDNAGNRQQVVTQCSQSGC